MTRDGALGRLLDSVAAAAKLSISQKTLERFVREKRIPAYRIGDGPKSRRRFSEIELDDWLRTRQTSTPAPEVWGDVYDETFR